MEIDWSKCVHTPECVAKRNALLAERSYWESLWPYACVSCEGSGWIGGYGVDYWGEANGDVCFECVYKGICPRCGGPGVGDWSNGFGECQDWPVACNICGWTGEREGDVKPFTDVIRDWCDCEFDFFAEHERQEWQARSAGQDQEEEPMPKTTSHDQGIDFQACISAAIEEARTTCLPTFLIFGPDEPTWSLLKQEENDEESVPPPGAVLFATPGGAILPCNFDGPQNFM